jgi:hypothetical protein
MLMRRSGSNSSASSRASLFTIDFANSRNSIAFVDLTEGNGYTHPSPLLRLLASWLPEGWKTAIASSRPAGTAAGRHRGSRFPGPCKYRCNPSIPVLLWFLRPLAHKVTERALVLKIQPQHSVAAAVFVECNWMSIRTSTNTRARNLQRMGSGNPGMVSS